MYTYQCLYTYVCFDMYLYIYVSFICLYIYVCYVYISRVLTTQPLDFDKSRELLLASVFKWAKSPRVSKETPWKPASVTDNIWCTARNIYILKFSEKVYLSLTVGIMYGDHLKAPSAENTWMFLDSMWYWKFKEGVLSIGPCMCRVVWASLTADAESSSIDARPRKDFVLKM